jgi:hypothetical protein
MIKSKYLKLIHKEIDGEISAENKNKLLTYLSQNDEAHAVYDQLRYTTNLLKNVPEVESPPDLTSDIMNSINFNRYSNEMKTRFDFVRIINWFIKPTPKPAYAFALGLIFGLIFYAIVIMMVFKEQPVDLADLYGTISTVDKSEVENISTHAVDLPGANGSINLRRIHNTLLFEINIQPTDNFELKMKYDTDDFAFAAYHPLCPAHTNFDNQESSISISSSDNAAFVLFFTKNQDIESSLDLTIETTGKDVFRHSFLIQK